MTCRLTGDAAVGNFDERQPAPVDNSPVAAYWRTLFVDQNASLERAWEQPRQPVIIEDKGVNDGRAKETA